MKKILFILFILIFSFDLSPFAEAKGASLYLLPTTGTFFVGATFDVSIFVNTGENSINAVKVDLKFDPKKLQISSPTAGKSFISVWVSQPTYSNIHGTASFQGGMPSPGIKTSSGLVSTITFRAVAPGTTIIEFLDSSRILLDDGQGTDILTSLGSSSYQLTIPPPEGPKIFSSTHPDQNKWVSNNSPAFSWEKEAGITGFSYSVNQSFYDMVDNISEGSHTSISYTDLEDGIWFFHIKARKGNIWGGVSHYIVMIDKTPPAVFNLGFEPKLKSPVSTSQEPVIYFITTDNLSGISHYVLKLINLTNSSTEESTSFFIEVNSPYKMPFLEASTYRVVVRAFDAAMNFRDATEKIEVIPLGKIFFITKSGISIFSFFLSWWKIIFILTPLIILVLIVTFRWRKIYKYIHQRRQALGGVEEKTRHEKEELKNRLDQFK